MSKPNTSKISAEKAAGAVKRSGKPKSTIRDKSRKKRDDGGMDWAAFRSLTEAEVMTAALSDPDAQPLTGEDFKRMKRKPRCYSIRLALHMTQEEFAAAFRIPVGTIRDWEQWRTEPDQSAKAYLKVIATNPQYVLKALCWVPGAPKPTAD